MLCYMITIENAGFLSSFSFYGAFSHNLLRYISYLCTLCKYVILLISWIYECCPSVTPISREGTLPRA
jgi:hypothetical protein